MDKRVAYPIFLAAFAALAWAGTTDIDDAADTGAANIEQNVAYGSVEGTQLLLDVYRPSGPSTNSHPGILLIHGGGWTALDKSTMRKMGQFLARDGFVCFSVDYRLFRDGKNPWPAQLDDVQRAVRWIRANGPKYDVAPQHIGAFGHSAGAQLASLLGMEDTRDNSDPSLAEYSSKVQAVVEVSGPTDFTVNHDADGDAFLGNFLGGSYEQNPQRWQKASPVFHVGKSNAPFLIVHGTLDQNVPISQAEELYGRLRAAGVPALLVKVDDYHTFRTPTGRRQLAIQTLEFFDKYLRGDR